MKNWIKKEISRDQVLALHNRFGLDALTASILCRRGITSGHDLLWFLEDDLRFCHNPFEFCQMEDAVDRILLAKEEGEKVLIFGDRDVDGITATAVLFQQLKRMGIDVSWRLPGGDDAYGLSMQAVDDFAKNYGSLLITVDCGISNNAEIKHANELGISVIITDHHEAPENLPEADIIINPKCKGSGYPFQDISGCAVAYKLASALRFSQSGMYKEDVSLLNVRPSTEEEKKATGTEGPSWTVEAARVRNLVLEKHFARVFDAQSEYSVDQSGLLDFLRGQEIFCWDKTTVTERLRAVFGNQADFNMFDIRDEVSKIIPQTAGLALEKIKGLSKIARYEERPISDLMGFFNIFVTYINKSVQAKTPGILECTKKDLQLVLLSVLSDIMPLKDENRIFVKQGLSVINGGSPRAGLVELLSRQGLLGKKINAHDLSWNIIPILNAAGRLGTPEDSLNLFLEESAQGREAFAEKILALNEERKNLEAQAIESLGGRPEDSLKKFNGKFCAVYDEKFNRGVIGRIASKLVSRVNAPSIAVTKTGDSYVGSMRAARGIHCVEFLDKFGNIYINHGGHQAAAGFSLTEENFLVFKERLPQIVAATELSLDETEGIEIDAELTPPYLTTGLISIVDKFEPYGNLSEELVFLTRGARIVNAQVMGRTERTHLKLWLQVGDLKWPALWWGEASRLGKDFNVGDKIDLLYNYERNTFNGHEERQLIIVDAERA